MRNQSSTGNLDGTRTPRAFPGSTTAFHSRADFALCSGQDILPRVDAGAAAQRAAVASNSLRRSPADRSPRQA